MRLWAAVLFVALATVAAGCGKSQSQKFADQLAAAGIRESVPSWKLCVLDGGDVPAVYEGRCNLTSFVVQQGQAVAHDIAKSDAIGKSEKVALLNQMLDFADAYCWECVPSIQRYSDEVTS